MSFLLCGLTQVYNYVHIYSHNSPVSMQQTVCTLIFHSYSLTYLCIYSIFLYNIKVRLYIIYITHLTCNSQLIDKSFYLYLNKRLLIASVIMVIVWEHLICVAALSLGFNLILSFERRNPTFPIILLLPFCFLLIANCLLVIVTSNLNAWSIIIHPAMYVYTHLCLGLTLNIYTFDY